MVHPQQNISVAITTSNGITIALWVYKNGSPAGDTKLFEITSEAVIMWMNDTDTNNIGNVTNFSIM